MITAVAFTGNISVGSLLTLAVSIVGLLTIYAQTAQLRARQSEIHDKIDSVDAAVNGKTPEQQSLRENVQDLHDDRDRTPHMGPGHVGT